MQTGSNIGGKQPHMEWKHSTNGVELQEMKVVLMEQGVDVQGMKAEDLHQILMEMDDFKYEKEQILKIRGHRCVFLPKSHCEYFRNVREYMRA